jgi:hypothetical protein
MFLKYLKYYFLLSLISFVVIGVQAQTLSIDENTLTLVSRNTLEGVDVKKGVVVIGDQVYKLKLNTTVYDNRNRVASRYTLKKGQKVRFKPSIKNGQRFIDSIRVISE